MNKRMKRSLVKILGPRVRGDEGWRVDSEEEKPVTVPVCKVTLRVRRRLPAAGLRDALAGRRRPLACRRGRDAGMRRR